MSDPRRPSPLWGDPDDIRQRMAPQTGEDQRAWIQRRGAQKRKRRAMESTLYQFNENTPGDEYTKRRIQNARELSRVGIDGNEILKNDGTWQVLIEGQGDDPEGFWERMVSRAKDGDLTHQQSQLGWQMIMGTMDLEDCLLYTSPSPRDRQKSRMPSSA